MTHFEAKVYAHSIAASAETQWEDLEAHLRAVARSASRFAAPFGWAAIALVAGRLHDIGKSYAAFQVYIRALAGRGCDHSTAGAREAMRLYPPLGGFLAPVIAGHHAGLADGVLLKDRLNPDKTPVPAYAGWEAHAGDLPSLSELRPTQPFARSGVPGFCEAFRVRMLFSCLVDADRLETEGFYARVEGRTVNRGGGARPVELRDRLRRFMAAKRAEAAAAAATPDARCLAALRAEVLDHAVARAGDAPGLFTLTVPTGGGKTLASLAFALEHAAAHGLRRVVHVAPFTAIIEQTAAVFRAALADDPDRPDILEHHASFDWEGTTRAAERAGRGTDPIDRLQRAAENWDVPVVVTTAVQLFESLFANRTSRCRKLHNLARSVIVLDEAQTLPLRLLRPCMAALEELANNYGASIVLCTATQPALRAIDGFEGGFAIDATRELAPDPPRLYGALQRVRVELRGATDDAAIAERFAQAPQMLCIVNNRLHAKALFARIRDLPGAIHLTTLMCPAHRRRVLDAARAALGRGDPCRIVATSLIEAGVDIDLPEVWRAAAGIEQIAQAAGRCNREFRMAAGRVVVFEPVEAKPPHDLKQAWEATRLVLPRHEDPLALDAVRDYFGELYWRKGPEAFDAATLDGERWPILSAIEERAGDLRFPFASIACAFRMADRAEAEAPGFSREKISFALVIGADGAVRDVADLRVEAGKKMQPRILEVPAAFKRTGAILPNRLWDKTAYVLGRTAGTGRRTAEEHAAFKALHRDLLVGTEDSGLAALLRFLDAWDPAAFDAAPFGPEMLDANVVFRLDGDRDVAGRPRFLHEREAARALATEVTEAETDRVACLVTGMRAPLRRLHPTTVIRRALRDHGEAMVAEEAEILRAAERCLTDVARRTLVAGDVDTLCGLEGEAAFAYFGCFNVALRSGEAALAFGGRSRRRPPLDRINALLSFLYALLGHDCRSALEAHGLDPQVGFLHADRPGRASLALDLMEELRPVLADRLALTLVNRRQLTADDFIVDSRAPQTPVVAQRSCAPTSATPCRRIVVYRVRAVTRILLYSSVCYEQAVASSRGRGSKPDRRGAVRPRSRRLLTGTRIETSSGMPGAWLTLSPFHGARIET